MAEKKFFCSCGGIGHILQCSVVSSGVEFKEHKLGKVDCKTFTLQKEDIPAFVELVGSEPRRKSADHLTDVPEPNSSASTRRRRPTE